MSVSLGPAGQSRRQVAVDVDQRLQLFWLWIELQFRGLRQDERADVGDVLTDLDGLLIIVAGHRAQKDRPELAVEKQCFGEIVSG